MTVLYYYYFVLHLRDPSLRLKHYSHCPSNGYADICTYRNAPVSRSEWLGKTSYEKFAANNITIIVRQFNMIYSWYIRHTCLRIVYAMSSEQGWNFSFLFPTTFWVFDLQCILRSGPAMIVLFFTFDLISVLIKTLKIKKQYKVL